MRETGGWGGGGGEGRGWAYSARTNEKKAKGTI